MKPAEQFDSCYARFRDLKEWLASSTGAVHSIRPDKQSAGYQWRPGRARACEYVADFERIGRHTLRRPEWKGRLKLFEMYFLRGLDYRRAISAVGVSEGTFDYWFREVKRALGAEFHRTGLFPPGQYFGPLAQSRPHASGWGLPSQMPAEIPGPATHSADVPFVGA